MEPLSNNPSKLISENSSNRHGGVADQVRDALDSMGHKVGDLASKTKEGLDDARSKVQSTASRVRRSSQQMVVDSPFRALAITAGAGVLIGVVLARSLFRH